MPDDQIYLTFGEDLRKLLASNSQARQRIEEELKKELPGATIQPGSLRIVGEVQHRDVFLVIIAAGITATLVAGAISRVLDAISRGKQASMKETHLKPALDGKGNPIRDASGQPVYEVDEKPGGPPPTGEVSTTKIGIPKILEFELSTGKPQSK